jgi:hypothetical protein
VSGRLRRQQEEAVNGRRASPSQTLAQLRATVEHPAFRELGAPAQAALLVSVVQFADRDGRWNAKTATVGRLIGRSDRRVRAALATCGALLSIEGRRRPDGTQTANEYALHPELVEQADETVRLWAGRRTEPSGGASPDEIVRPTSPDEIVRPRTSLNEKKNVLRCCAPPPDGPCGLPFRSERLLREHLHNVHWLDDAQIEAALRPGLTGPPARHEVRRAADPGPAAAERRARGSAPLRCCAPVVGAEAPNGPDGPCISLTFANERQLREHLHNVHWLDEQQIAAALRDAT